MTPKFYCKEYKQQLKIGYKSKERILERGNQKHLKCSISLVSSKNVNKNCPEISSYTSGNGQVQ